MVNLELGCVIVVTPRHPEVTHHKLWKEGQVEPDERDQCSQLPQLLRIHSPADLGPPIMQAAHKPGHHAADHDVMKMRYDKISVRHVNINRERCQEQTG